MQGYQQKILWVVALGMALWGLYQVQEVLFVLFGGFILASALFPLVNLLDRHLPRWLAVAIPFLMMLLLAVVVVFPILTMALQQLQLLVEYLPNYLEQAKQWIDSFAFIGKRYPFLAGLTPDSIIDKLSSQSGTMLSGFTWATLSVSKGMLDTLTALMIAFFLLLDQEKIEHYCFRLIPERAHVRIRLLMLDLMHSTGAFVNGQLLFMASFAFIIGLGLALLNVPFSILLGLLAGISTLLPIIGPNLVMLPTMVFAAVADGNLTLAMWVFLLFMGAQAVANNLIGPLIMGKAVGLHPLVIIVSIFAGGLLFGIPGILLAIPLAACLNILIEKTLTHEWALSR